MEWGYNDRKKWLDKAVYLAEVTESHFPFSESFRIELLGDRDCYERAILRSCKVETLRLCQVLWEIADGLPYLKHMEEQFLLTIEEILQAEGVPSEDLPLNLSYFQGAPLSIGLRETWCRYNANGMSFRALYAGELLWPHSLPFNRVICFLAHTDEAKLSGYFINYLHTQADTPQAKSFVLSRLMSHDAERHAEITISYLADDSKPVRDKASLLLSSSVDQVDDILNLLDHKKPAVRESVAASLLKVKRLKKQLKTVAESVRIRLEQSFATRRSWTYAAWYKLFVGNPTQHIYASGLVWGVYADLFRNRRSASCYLKLTPFWPRELASTKIGGCSGVIRGNVTGLQQKVKTQQTGIVQQPIKSGCSGCRESLDSLLYVQLV